MGLLAARTHILPNPVGDAQGIVIKRREIRSAEAAVDLHVPANDVRIWATREDILQGYESFVVRPVAPAAQHSELDKLSKPDNR